MKMLRNRDDWGWPRWRRSRLLTGRRISGWFLKRFLSFE
jgi:hypothetical protein